MQDSVSLQETARSSAAAPLTGSRGLVHEPRDMVMEGGDKKFYMRQHRNETYSEAAKKVKFIQWLMAQSDPSMQNQDFLTWFNRYYTIQEGGVHVRASIGLPEGAYVPRTKKKGIRKAPPNPLLQQKCTLPREVTYTHDPATCRHEVVDRRGSSKYVSRTFCKQCGTFIDEVPGDFHAQRKAAADECIGRHQRHD